MTIEVRMPDIGHNRLCKNLQIYKADSDIEISVYFALGRQRVEMYLVCKLESPNAGPSRRLAPCAHT